MKYYLLDTNILIGYADGKDKALGILLDRLAEKEGMFCTCDIALAEFVGGLSAAQLQRLTPFIDKLLYLGADRALSMAAARLFWDLSKKGRTVPLADCLIVAIARHYNAAVVTRDKKHFENLTAFAEIIFI